MQPISWHIQQIKQYNQQLAQAMYQDDALLDAFSSDFGRIHVSKPAVIVKPITIQDIQDIIRFANTHALPITIRGKGLSQGGQALASSGGVLLHLPDDQFNRALEETLSVDAIWVEANARFSDVLAISLKKKKTPPVLPYNMDLSVAGVLSAGGIGASSFKYGAVVDHVLALEVINSQGDLLKIDKRSPLFHACLGGQGQFGVITKAQLALRDCEEQVVTFMLLYENKDIWLADLNIARQQADYIEAFCSPAILGTKLEQGKRKPFANWSYVIQITLEYDKEQPAFPDNFNPHRLLYTQTERLQSFLIRHKGRFEMMKMSGQWDLYHPWYECFVPMPVLEMYLSDVLDAVPLYYASVLQIVPIKRVSDETFFMLPEGESSIAAVTILNPGIVPPLLSGCIETIQLLDSYYLPRGGKRYLSGYLGERWDLKNHLGRHFSAWQALKKQYDPQGIFSSMLMPSKSSLSRTL